MNIVVSYKIVPDEQDAVVQADRTLSFERAALKIGDYDLNAVEAGAQLASASGASLVSLTAGGDPVEDSKLKKAILARGPHENVAVKDASLPEAGSAVTARVLAAAVKQLDDVSLVLCGEGSADRYAQQVGVQLGELLGVTRQAVSKWESGQTTPDAATIAALCEKLHVSADYVLLGKEPGEGQTAAYEPPDTCPCCGRKVSGSICPECGYQLPNHPPRGPQYAVVATRPGFVQSTESSAQLVKYCGFTQEDANNAIAHYVNNQSRILLRRGLVDSAAQYIAAHLDQDFFCPQIVVDCGESEEALLYKPKAFETPSPVKSQEGIGFWGVVGAVIVALLILSFF